MSDQTSFPPPVCTLTYTRSGVCYVERSGPVSGSFGIQIKTANVDDFLASVSTRGPVRGIGFETRRNADPELKDRGLDLTPTGVYRELFAGKLRGTQVTLTLRDRTRLQGRVVGIDKFTTFGADPASSVHAEFYVVLYDVSANIVKASFSDIESVAVEDSRVPVDLNYYLQVASASDLSRTLQVQVDVKPDSRVPVSLGYLTSAPVWRIKYDLSIEDSAAGQLELTSWAIVHNPLPESLVGVQVRLGTGRPMSFLNDLATPLEASRETVRDEVRVAAPSQYRATLGEVTKGVVRARSATRSFESSAFESFAAVASSVMEDSSAGTSETEVRAETVDAGEETEFVVSGVDLPSGGAVTLVTARVSLSGEVVRTWRAGTRHPELAVRMVNGGGATLEKGPVTLKVNGRFVGQAMIPYAPRGATVYVAYAQDQAISLTSEEVAVKGPVSQVRAGAGVLVVSTSSTREIRIRAVSAHSSETHRVMVECLRRPGAELVPVEGIRYLEPTADSWRFEISVPPGESQVAVPYRVAGSHQVAVNNFHAPSASVWFRADGVLQGSGLRAALGQLLRTADEYEASRVSVAQCRDMLQEGLGLSRDLIQRLKDLGGLPTVAAIAANYTRDLEATDGRVAELKKTMSSLEEESRQARVRYEEAAKKFFDSLSPEQD